MIHFIAWLIAMWCSRGLQFWPLKYNLDFYCWQVFTSPLVVCGLIPQTMLLLCERSLEKYSGKIFQRFSWLPKGFPTPSQLHHKSKHVLLLVDWQGSVSRMWPPSLPPHPWVNCVQGNHKPKCVTRWNESLWLQFDSISPLAALMKSNVRVQRDNRVKRDP